MPHEDHIARLIVEDATGILRVGRNRCERILDGDNVYALALQDGDDLAPDGAVLEGAVNEDDGDRRPHRLRTPRDGERGRKKDGCEDLQMSRYRVHGRGLQSDWLLAERMVKDDRRGQRLDD